MVINLAMDHITHREGFFQIRNPGGWVQRFVAQTLKTKILRRTGVSEGLFELKRLTEKPVGLVKHAPGELPIKVSAV